MVRVTVEIVPHGIEWKSHKVGSITIENTESDSIVANYRYLLSDDRTGVSSGRIDKFKRGQGIWRLIFEVLKHAN